MDVIYGLIPMMLFFGFLVVVVFIWMAKKGYFEDMDGQANRILMDDDFEQPSSSHLENSKPESNNAAEIEKSIDVEEVKELNTAQQESLHKTDK